MFRLRGRTVFTDGNTEYKGKKNGCDDLRNGTNVEVDGRVYSNGTVLALRIKVEKKKDDD